MWGCRHVFLATGDDDFAVTPCHSLRGQHHGLQARTTHGIDGQCGGFFGQTSLHDSLTGGVLPCTSGQHLTHDDFAHGVGRQAAALQQALDDDAAQVGGGSLGQ